jgi:hypothetical protein
MSAYFHKVAHLWLIALTCGIKLENVLKKIFLYFCQPQNKSILLEPSEHKCIFFCFNTYSQVFNRENGY